MKKYVLLVTVFIFLLSSSLAVALDIMPEESFESAVPPTNWIGYQESGNAWQQTTDRAKSGSYSAYHDYTSDDHNAWLITPEIDLSGYQNQKLIYWENVNFGSYADYHYVKLSTDYSGSGDPNGANWTILEDGIGTENTWKEKTIDISSYSGTVYIAFQYIGTYASEWYIDDVKITGDVIGSPGEPTNPNPADDATDVSITTDLSWTNGADTENVDVYLSTTESDVINKNVDAKVVDTQNIQNYDPGTLSYNTEYFWRVVAKNSNRLEKDGDVWNFITSCEILTPPVSENFDSTTPPTMPGCWPAEDTNDDNYTWQSSTSNSLYYLTNSSNAADDWFFSPPIHLTGGTTYMVDFYYQGNSIFHPEKLEVKWGTAPNSANMTEGPIFSHDNIINMNYDLGTGFITPTSDGTYYVGWHCFSDANTWKINVDNIDIYAIPPCPHPSNPITPLIKPTSADVGWTENGSATLWDIEWGTSGFTPDGTPDIDGTTENPHTITGLTPEAIYEFYVRSDCGGGDYSDWAGPYSFRMPCAAYSPPISESFDNSVIPPECWTNPIGEWNFNTNAEYGAAEAGDHTGNDGSNYAWVDGDEVPDITNNTLISPYIDASGLTDPMFLFWVFSNNINNPGDNVTLTVDFFDGASWNTVHTFSDDHPVWFPIIPDLSGITITDDVRLRFVVDATTTDDWAMYNDLLIDDVEFKETPTEPVSFITPDTKNFGIVNLGETSSPQTITIINIGGGTLTIDPAVSLSGTHPDEFSLIDGNTYPVNLTSGETMTVDVAFAPTSEGNKSAILQIQDNISRATHEISLIGEAINYNYGGGEAGTGGYYFANSTSGGAGAPSQPTYAWYANQTSGANEGTLIPDTDFQYDGGNEDDGYTDLMNIFDDGSAFTFFGIDYTQMYLSSNGTIGFGSSPSPWAYYPLCYGIPLDESVFWGAALNNIIAWCWQDLEYDSSISPDVNIRLSRLSDRTVVTFWHYPTKEGTGGYITAQVIIYKNGNIKIQYNDDESTYNQDAEDNAIGIENADGTAGIQYRYNGVGGPMFSSPVAVMFGTDEGALPVVLSDFYAEVITGGIQLHWTTASEMNNAGFKVYRKAGDLPGFQNLSGLIPGGGTTTELQKYSFTDKDIQPDVLYTYQLADIEEGTEVETLHPAITIMATKEALQAKEIPKAYKLYANYPNPFNPTTTIAFDVPDLTGFGNLLGLSLKIYDVSGKLVKTLIDEPMEAGNYSVSWHGKDDNGNEVNSGVYYCKMVTETYSETRQLVLLK